MSQRIVRGGRRAKDRNRSGSEQKIVLNVRYYNFTLNFVVSILVP